MKDTDAVPGFAEVDYVVITARTLDLLRGQETETFVYLRMVEQTYDCRTR